MSWNELRHDIRYTLRSFRRNAGFFVAAVLIIGLGIGANTTIFSVVNALLFRPLAFQNPERLVWIANTGNSGLSGVTSRVSNYVDWRAMNHSLEGMAAYFAFFDYGSYKLAGSGEPERLVGVGVSQDLLSFLGVPLQVGRGFTEDEAKWNGTPAVILTHGLWERRFGKDPRIVGQAITLNEKSTVVVGVLPPSFDFSSVFTPGSRVDMLVPFPITPETDRWGNTLAVLGRLKPGVSVQQAQAEFDVLNQQLKAAHPERWTWGAKFTPLQEYLTGRFRRGLLVLLGAVAAVLLIACTNLSNLMLARATARRREMAVRSALGASRARLVRQMLTESLVLSLAGAVVGLFLAWIGIRYLGSVQGISIPLLETVKIDSTALLFTLCATLLTGLIFGIVPALQSSGVKEAESLKDSGRGATGGRRTAWTRNTLVVTEVALACVLLVGAGLLIRSFLRVLDVDLGFRPEYTASWRLDLASQYNNAASQAAFYDRVIRAVQAVPGVESASVTDALPLSRDRSWGLGAKGVTYPKDQYPLGHPRIIDWRYLQTMKIPLLAGRYLEERDSATSEKVIVINEKAAQQLWPGENAIGKIAINNGELRVVGVVGNVRHESVEQSGGLEMYFPMTQMGSNSTELVVRTRIATAAVAPGIRAALRSVDSTLPNAEYQQLGDLVDRAVSPRRFMVYLLGGFAGAALLLASVGIFGVISYTVTQRTSEIGIRMALGASAGLVQRQVLGRTAALVAAGVALGVVAALVLGRLTAALLYQMEPTDPLTYAATVAVLLVVAIAAGYLPARRASRVDPMSALRAN